MAAPFGVDTQPDYELKIVGGRQVYVARTGEQGGRGGPQQPQQPQTSLQQQQRLQQQAHFGGGQAPHYVRQTSGLGMGGSTHYGAPSALAAQPQAAAQPAYGSSNHAPTGRRQAAAHSPLNRSWERSPSGGGGGGGGGGFGGGSGGATGWPPQSQRTPFATSNPISARPPSSGALGGLPHGSYTIATLHSNPLPAIGQQRPAAAPGGTAGGGVSSGAAPTDPATLLLLQQMHSQEAAMAAFLAGLGRLDRDKHGCIDHDAIARVVRQSRLVVDTGMLNALLRKFDRRMNGSVDFLEFNEVVSTPPPPTAQGSMPTRSGGGGGMALLQQRSSPGGRSALVPASAPPMLGGSRGDAALGRYRQAAAHALAEQEQYGRGRVMSAAPAGGAGTGGGLGLASQWRQPVAPLHEEPDAFEEADEFGGGGDGGGRRDQMLLPSAPDIGFNDPDWIDRFCAMDKALQRLADTDGYADEFEVRRMVENYNLIYRLRLTSEMVDTAFGRCQRDGDFVHTEHLVDVLGQLVRA